MSEARAAEAPGLTEQIAAFAAGAEALATPAAALAAARRAVIDTVGVMLAGRREAAPVIVGETLAAGEEAFSLSGRRWMRAQDAALLDGVAGHVLDYDDVAQHGHPSVVIVPALLAEAQRLGASGQSVLRAYLIGYETWCELARREPDAYHLGAWHPTSILGVVAATAALVALHRLEQRKARHALAIAASFASGVIANFGSHAKPLQAGRAAAASIEAVRLAQAGMTGAADAIEGAHGLLRGVSPHGRADTDTPVALGDGAWRVLTQGLSVKRYPVCYAAHRAIDGVLALAGKAKLAPAQVRAVRVSLGPAPAATLRYHDPKDGLEARFSLHHNVAAALVDGAVGFAQLSDAFVRREDVAALYRLTEMEIVDEACDEQPGMAKFDRVRITLADGQELDSGPIRYARGHARLPLSDEEMSAKFLDCARHGAADNPERLLAALQGLEQVATMREMASW